MAPLILRYLYSYFFYIIFYSLKKLKNYLYFLLNIFKASLKSAQNIKNGIRVKKKQKWWKNQALNWSKICCSLNKWKYRVYSEISFIKSRKCKYKQENVSNNTDYDEIHGLLNLNINNRFKKSLR